MVHMVHQHHHLHPHSQKAREKGGHPTLTQRTTQLQIPQPKKIKVLQVTSSYLPIIGGRENYVKGISEGLARAGFDVTILTGATTYSDTIEDSVRVIRTPYQSIPTGNLIYRIPQRITQTILQLQPDIIQTHDQFHSVSLISALVKRKSKLVITCHAYPGIYDNNLLLKTLTRIYGFIISPLLFHRSDCVLLFSEQPTYMSKLTRPTFGFVDTNYIDKTHSISLQEQLSIRGQTIFFCSRLEKRKGLKDLIQAFQEVQRSHPDTTLIISGPDAGELRPLKEISQRIPNIILTGSISDSVLHSTLSQSTMFVLPTHSDQVPASILKAMYLGCPVISTTIDSIPKIIRKGIDGILIEPSDISSLVNSINLLLDRPDLCTFLKTNAKERVATHYTLDAQVQHLIQVYKEILPK